MHALEVLAILADRVHQNLSDRTSPPIFQCGKVRQFEIIINNTYSSIKFIFFYHALCGKWIHTFQPCILRPNHMTNMTTSTMLITNLSPVFQQQISSDTNSVCVSGNADKRQADEFV